MRSFGVVSAQLNARVLLVDDAPDEREMYAEWFQRLGCFTLQAANVRDAYRLAVELHPELVITDVKLLGTEDGLSLTRRLKECPETRDVAVVVLSGYVFKNNDEAARLAGCDLVLHKPCLPDELASVVQQLLAQRRDRVISDALAPTRH